MDKVETTTKLVAPISLAYEDASYSESSNWLNYWRRKVEYKTCSALEPGWLHGRNILVRQEVTKSQRQLKWRSTAAAAANDIIAFNSCSIPSFQHIKQQRQKQQRQQSLLE